MRAFEVQVGTAKPVIVRCPEALPEEAAEAFSALLPFTTTIRQSEWCGQAASAESPASSFDSASGAAFRAASLYPGWLGWDPARRQLLLSYGKAEYRCADGLQYAWMLGCAATAEPSFLSAIAALHDDGQAPLTIRPANGSVTEPAGRQVVLSASGERHAVELLDGMASQTVAHLVGLLPLTVKLRPAKWSGDVLSGAVASPADADGIGIEHPAASLYPGTLAVRPASPDGWELLFSYGRTELRHAEGMAYATPVGRVDESASTLQQWLGAISHGSDCVIQITAS